MIDMISMMPLMVSQISKITKIFFVRYLRSLCRPLRLTEIYQLRNTTLRKVLDEISSTVILVQRNALSATYCTTLYFSMVQKFNDF